MTDLELTVDGRSLEAKWLDANREIREALVEALPVAGQGTRWGEELYFRTVLAAEPGTTATEVPVGTIAYWSPGEALCLFWGPTPASTDGTPKAAGQVAPIASVEDVSPLADLDGGAVVHVALAD